MQNLIKSINATIHKLQLDLDRFELAFGESIYNNNECQILTQSAEKFEFLFSDMSQDNEITLYFIGFGDDLKIVSSSETWNRFGFAALLELRHELSLLDAKVPLEHKKYTQQGMIKRVLHERMQKALVAKYKVTYAKNKYGDHIVTNENGVKYKVFLRDFENETGYSNSKDSALNKLGTTKHIMFVFNELKNNPKLLNKLDQTCPFIEIYLDPLNEYRITWFYPHQLSVESASIIEKYFGKAQFIDDNKIEEFVDFLIDVQQLNHFVVRPEVIEKLENEWEERSLALTRKSFVPDFSGIRATLYPYQKEGIAFAACRKSAIIADEMGLGKTIQAIGTAIQKKELFGFKKMLIVCPASLKTQWKSEIEKFTNESVAIVEGSAIQREQLYKTANNTFLIVNYESVLRDQMAIRKANFDFVILDEAQRVKNFATKTAHAIKQIRSKHTLIITGTPIENKLIDLYSLVSILDERFLGPLWEFSYQHCLFDPEKENKINGYYNLQSLKQKLETLLIRREKYKVINELPQVQQQEIFVGMTPLQADFHNSNARALSQLIRKKFLTPYDLNKMQMLLANMRMVCDSTFLLDDSTNDSPKLDELKYILLEKLDLQNSDRKVIIFSEWVKVHKLIGNMLRENNIGFAELNGSVAVNKRGSLIKRFETNSTCKVFLSTEAGGAGLNLQMADILINFELPWNPAKKNQRIGRIDRLGQKSKKLNIYNFITNNSIEIRIASGLLVKQNLFEGVLNNDNPTDFVDFSEKGRSQFLDQIAEMVAGFDENENRIIPEEVFEISPMAEPEEEPTEEIVLEDIGENNGPLVDVSVESEADVNVAQPSKAKQMEEVLNNGMQFLSGLFQMATGNAAGFKDSTIDVNEQTGEVTMKFKIPV